MIVGVDLGTTNTVVATDATARALSTEVAPILPSVIAYPPNGKHLVGAPARERRAIDPVNTIYSSKRIIGRRWTAPETRDFDGRYPFSMAGRDDYPIFVTRAGERSPEDIAATILEHVLAHLAELGAAGARAPSLELVIAVPAGFGPQQRAATLVAARQAGVQSVRLVEEPIATVRAFASVETLPSGPLAVFDLGGGTFELAVIDDGEVVGMGSDLYLGGDDIDRAISDFVAAAVLASHRWDLRDDPIVYDRLVLACEAAKRQLSALDSVVLSLGDVDPALPGAARELALTREQLDALATPIIRRTFIHCDEALASAAIDRASVSAVLLAGGSSQLAIVAEMVGQYFGARPLSPKNPMELVAIGASIA